MKKAYIAPFVEEHKIALSNQILTGSPVGTMDPNQSIGNENEFGARELIEFNW